MQMNDEWARPGIRHGFQDLTPDLRPRQARIPSPTLIHPIMSDNTFEPKIVGFLCNWCSYRAADLAGSARIKYAGERAHHPRDVQRPRRSGVRLQGPRLGRRRRDGRRLPSGRMPLHRTELQGHAAIPHAQALAAGVGLGGRPRAAGLGLGGRRPAFGRARSRSSSRTSASWGRLTGRGIGPKTASGCTPLKQSSRNTQRRWR